MKYVFVLQCNGSGAAEVNTAWKWHEISSFLLHV